MGHLDVVRHYEKVAEDEFPKYSLPEIKRIYHVFTLGCCSRHQPAADGV